MSKYPLAIVIIGSLLICSIHLGSPPSSVQGSERRVRWATIDGLRGFLALGVYIHHAAFVFTYLKTGSWKINSSFYFLFGELGVVFFFLITAFLIKGRFSTKNPLLVGAGFTSAKSFILPFLSEGHCGSFSNRHFQK